MAAALHQSEWSTVPLQTHAQAAAGLWSSLSWSQSSLWWSESELNPQIVWPEPPWAPVHHRPELTVQVRTQSLGSLRLQGTHSFPSVSALGVSVSVFCHHCGLWRARPASAPGWGWIEAAADIDCWGFWGVLQQWRGCQFHIVWSTCSPERQERKDFGGPTQHCQERYWLYYLLFWYVYVTKVMLLWLWTSSN